MTIDAEKIARVWAKHGDKIVRPLTHERDATVMAKALLTAIEALETYAQFADNGERAIVSGRLASSALSAIRGEDKEAKL